MKTYTKEELKRALLSKTSLLTFCISIILTVIIGAGNNILKFLDVTSVFQIVYSGYLTGDAYLALTFPIIAVMPFSLEYLRERKSGYSAYIQLRMKKKDYMRIRFIINGLVGSFAVSIGVFVNLVIGLILFLMGKMLLMPRFIQGVESTLYNQGITSFAGNMAIVFIFLFISGFICATMAMALSTIIKNIYLVAILPFLVFIFTQAVGGGFSSYLYFSHVYDISWGNWPGEKFLVYDKLLIAFIWLILVSVIYIWGYFDEG